MAEFKLDKVRKQKRMSKRELSKRLGIKYGNVFRLFQKGYDPKLSLLVKCARALGCKIKDLISEGGS